MARIAVVVILGFILTGPCIAEAACAWVLWQEMTPLGGDSVWRLLAAFPGHADCESQVAARHAGVKEMRPESRTVQRTPEGMVEKEFYPGGFNATSFVWRCLPDTIDPRGARK